MSYTKLPKVIEIEDALAAPDDIDATKEEANAPIHIAAALNSVFFDEYIEDEVLRQSLLKSGITVKLDNGQKVWVACGVMSNPSTFLISLLAVAISLDAVRLDNHPLATVYTSSFQPQIVEQKTLNAIRKAMMLVVLGEDAPAVKALGLNDDELAQRSIRPRLNISTKTEATLDDVL